MLILTTGHQILSFISWVLEADILHRTTLGSKMFVRIKELQIHHNEGLVDSGASRDCRGTAFQHTSTIYKIGDNGESQVKSSGFPGSGNSFGILHVPLLHFIAPPCPNDCIFS